MLSVPLIWRYEVANVLRTGVKLNRISSDDLSRVMALLGRPNLRTLDLTLRELAGPVLALAVAHNISVYDASYLHVALAESLPLATRDKRLRSAAVAAGCQLFA